MITPRHNVFFIGHLFAILTDSHFCGRDLSTNDFFHRKATEDHFRFLKHCLFQNKIIKKCPILCFATKYHYKLQIASLGISGQCINKSYSCQIGKKCILPIQFQNPNRKKLSRKYCIGPGTSGTGRPGNFQNPRILEFSCTDQPNIFIPGLMGCQNFLGLHGFKVFKIVVLF